jgi:hypothetical protein
MKLWLTLLWLTDVYITNNQFHTFTSYLAQNMHTSYKLQWSWRALSSGTHQAWAVCWMSTDVSEEHAASIFRSNNNLKMVAICSSKMSANFQPTTWCYVPEDSSLHLTDYQTTSCKIWGFHGDDYEECCVLGCDAMWLLLELTSIIRVKRISELGTTVTSTRAAGCHIPKDGILQTISSLPIYVSGLSKMCSSWDFFW